MKGYMKCFCLLAALALILCLALAACKGPDDKQGAANTPEPEKATAAPTEAPAEAPTEEPTPEPTEPPYPIGALYKREKQTIIREDGRAEGIREYDYYGHLLKKYEISEGIDVPTYDETYEYNEHGDAIRTNVPGAWYEYVWEYDELGRKIFETKNFYYDDSDEVRASYTYKIEYTEDGHTVSTRTDGGGHSVTERDENGRLIRADNTYYEYDEHGELTAITDKDGKKKQRYDNVYDENGRLTEQIWYMPKTTPDGQTEKEPITKTTYEYNEAGELIESCYYESENGELKLSLTVLYEYEYFGE